MSLLLCSVLSFSLALVQHFCFFFFFPVIHLAAFFSVDFSLSVRLDKLSPESAVWQRLHKSKLFSR